MTGLLSSFFGPRDESKAMLRRLATRRLSRAMYGYTSDCLMSEQALCGIIYPPPCPEIPRGCRTLQPPCGGVHRRGTYYRHLSRGSSDCCMNKRGVVYTVYSFIPYGAGLPLWGTRLVPGWALYLARIFNLYLYYCYC